MNKSDLQKLLDLKTENQNLDYKRQIDWDNSAKADRGEIIKDILAFSNTADGGRILFGIRDDEFEAVGVSEEVYANFDVTKVNNLLKGYTEPIHYCYVYKIENDGKFFVVIEVPEFSSVPIICKKNLSDENGKPILKEGAIYIRNGAAESIQINNAVMMGDLLVRALRRKSTEILSNIETLLQGGQRTSSKEDIYADELQIAENQIQMRIGKVIDEHEYGYNQLVVYPSIEMSSVFVDSFVIREHLRKSQVRYRGWDFPHEQINALCPSSVETFSIFR